MRKLIDIIVEAPIQDIELTGSPWRAGKPFAKGTSFSKADRGILQSTKGIAKIVKAFQKTPYDFEIFFVNTQRSNADKVDDNENVDDFALKVKAGVHDDYGIIKGKPGVIRAAILGNLSPIDAKMPMTAWTLAHKIAHAFQDQIINYPHADVERRVQTILDLLSEVVAPGRGTRYTAHDSRYADKALTDIMTMKSARTGKLDNEFEAFAELLAQYLITGKIKLDVEGADEPIMQVNAAINDLFKSVEGKVLVAT